MYEYLNGTLKEKLPEYIVVDVNGLGYRCLVPLSTFSQLPEMDKNIFLYISFIVREDAQILYGFLSKHERDLFEMLITVSGIGPKTALALVGHLELPAFQTAVHEENIGMISKVPGIGKKTAGRLIMEMKDKVPHLEKMKTDANLDSIDRLALDAILRTRESGVQSCPGKKGCSKSAQGTRSLKYPDSFRFAKYLNSLEGPYKKSPKTEL